jgi:glutathione S-transferase
MKLYSGPVSMFGAKAEIALLEKGIAHEREFVPFDLRTLYQPRHPVVLRVNPKQQVPVLVDGDLELFDSTQIFEYLEDVAPEPPLWPREPRARARARLLELRSDEVFFPHVITLNAAAHAGDAGADTGREGRAARRLRCDGAPARGPAASRRATTRTPTSRSSWRDLRELPGRAGGTRAPAHRGLATRGRRAAGGEAGRRRDARVRREELALTQRRHRSIGRSTPRGRNGSSIALPSPADA